LILLSSIFFGLFQRRTRARRLIEIDNAPRRKLEFIVDINLADWPEFTVLPGISETFARRIIEDRTERGPFQSIDDLQRVPGLGDKTVQRLRPYLTVASEPREIEEKLQSTSSRPRIDK
jgi:competence ComEA-like helix-hairpin-helix protein